MASNTSNTITPEFRAAFISVFRATSMKNQDGSTSKPKFSVRACFPPTADLKGLKNLAASAASDKWGDKIPKVMRSPFRKNSEIENPIVGIGDDWTIMTFSANEDRRPGVVDAKVQDILDESQVYSGAWYIADVRAYAYDTAGNKGVAFGLQNIQKRRDDDPLGGGKMPASKVFEAAADEEGTKTASALFD